MASVGGMVAVITRTKNRPILLPRVLDSIRGQSYRDFTWVLVNDAGDKEPVDKIAERAAAEGITLQLIHREESCGMEAASNQGIRQSGSKNIVIHDEDDSWEAEFLASTVAFMENSTLYMGVTTHSWRIDEIIDGDAVVTKRKSPFNFKLETVLISQMCRVNIFPPISFLFRRALMQGHGRHCRTVRGRNSPFKNSPARQVLFACLGIRLPASPACGFSPFSANRGRFHILDCLHIDRLQFFLMSNSPIPKAEL